MITTDATAAYLRLHDTNDRIDSQPCNGRIISTLVKGGMSVSPAHAPSFHRLSVNVPIGSDEPSDSPVVPRLDGRNGDVMASNDAAANIRRNNLAFCGCRAVG